MYQASVVFVVAFCCLATVSSFNVRRVQSPSRAVRFRDIKKLSMMTVEYIDPLVQVAQHAHHQLDLLHHSISLADDPAAAVSIYSKVDKSGPIGGFASIIETIIDFFHTTLNKAGIKNSYGFSIIGFTCIIKALTLPLTTQQLESTTKMQKLQPLQQKIQAKYSRPEQEQTKNQLLSQLFQAANVNPLAGCFPALAQIPIFLSLYRALQNLVAENKLDEPFLWIPDLEGPVYMKPPGESLDWVKSIFSGTPALGWDDTLAFLTIPVILFISQTISTKALQPPKDPNRVLTDQELTSQGIVNNIPFIVSFFSLNVPSGLGIYWIINNILTTAINLAVKAGLKDEAMPVEVEKMMAAIEADTISVGGSMGGGAPAGGNRMSSAQAELGRTGSKMSDEDRERLEKFESMQKKGGFGSASASTASSTTEEIIDVTPVDPAVTTASPSTAEAGGVEEPKGPIGKTLKFLNENAAKVEESVDEANQIAAATENDLAEKVEAKIREQKSTKGSRKKNKKKK